MIWKTKPNACRGEIDLSAKSVVMGILNVTPDSFSDGGQFNSLEFATSQAMRLKGDGAMIIDIGGESTRPGATPVDEKIEMQRVIPVVDALRSNTFFDETFISIDTTKSSVAEAAILAGADIVNDVTGLTSDRLMVEVCEKYRAGVIVMHMQGTPQTMQENPTYKNAVEDIRSFFSDRFQQLIQAGIDSERICFDPGIGFGKLDDHNLHLMASIDALSVMGRPVLLGVSRKSIFSRLLNLDDTQERDAATVAMTAAARLKGCMLHRVHAVKENHDALRMIELLMSIEGV